MQVLLRVADGELDRHLGEERVRPEVAGGVEAQPVAARAPGRRRGRARGRRRPWGRARAPPAVARALSSTTATPAAGRPAARSSTWVVITRPPRSRTRRPTILPTSASAVAASASRLAVQPRGAPRQQRLDRVLAHAGDEREAEARAVVGVERPQRLQLVGRQPVQPRGVLLGGRVGGQLARRRLAPGELGVGVQDLQRRVGGRGADRGLERELQALDGAERPLLPRLFGDPRRVLDDGPPSAEVNVARSMASTSAMAAGAMRGKRTA